MSTLDSDRTPTGEMSEQKLLFELARRNVPVQLLCEIGDPAARRKYMENELERARISDMSEQDLDMALIRKGISLRLLWLIEFPEPRIAAKREALRTALKHGSAS